MEGSGFGIYLNKATCKIVRANSSLAIPSGSQWVLLTSEVNATLPAIRALARETGLIADASSVIWE